MPPKIDADPSGINRGAEPAFPADGPVERYDCGLTVREYVATAALQGLLSSPQYYGTVRDEIGRYAVIFADALLKALEERKP